jgi:hypothetical protein
MGPQGQYQQMSPYQAQQLYLQQQHVMMLGGMGGMMQGGMMGARMPVRVPPASLFYACYGMSVGVIVVMLLSQLN